MTTAREATSHLADLLSREHHVLAEFLVALAAFDAEGRWVELGYRSLFDFLRRELRLSAGAAQYRKTAAELIRKYPAVEAGLRSGDLCLSSVVEVGRVITPENAAEILPRFFGRSSRDAAFVAASIRPVENPPRRDFFVTPVRAEAAAGVSAATATAEVRAPEVAPAHLEVRAPQVSGSGASQVRAPEVPFAGPVAPALPSAADRPRIRPLDAERARVNMTVSRRLLDKLAAARDALSHSHPRATEDEILEVGLDLILERHAKRRGLVAKPRKPAPAPSSSVPVPPSARSRHIPAAVAREVWKRDQGKCQWPVDGGGVCGSSYQVELDHIDGFALGGATTVDRCRVLCRPHQDVHARALYGDAVMDTYTRPKGGRCSEPVARWGAHAPSVRGGAAASGPLTAPRGRRASPRDRRRSPRPPLRRPLGRHVRRRPAPRDPSARSAPAR